MTLRRAAFDLLEHKPFESGLARLINGFLVALILVNVGVVVVESVDWIYARYQQYFDAFELFRRQYGHRLEHQRDDRPGPRFLEPNPTMGESAGLSSGGSTGFASAIPLL